MISINIQPSPSPSPSQLAADIRQSEELAVEVQQKLVLDYENSSQLRGESGPQVDVKETKPAKPKRIKVREIKQEAQTGEPLLSFFVGY